MTTNTAKQYAKAIKDAKPGEIPHIPIDFDIADNGPCIYPPGSKLADPNWTGDKPETKDKKK